MIRHFVRDTLPPFFKQLDNAKNGREAAQILVRFLTNAGVVDQLMAWRDQAIDAGDLVTAGQPEQTWNTFCDLLDEYVTILGDRQFVADDFFWLCCSLALKGQIIHRFLLRWIRYRSLKAALFK